MSTDKTTELLRRLALRARCPEPGRVDGLSSSEDWQAAHDEIVRLRSALGNIACRYAPPADEVTARFARVVLGEGWRDA